MYLYIVNKAKCIMNLNLFSKLIVDHSIGHTEGTIMNVCETH